MPEFISEYKYEFEREDTMVICLNMSRNTRFHFDAKAVGSTHALAIRNLLDRHESISWTGNLVDANANPPTLYQQDSILLEHFYDSPEFYSQVSLRVYTQDYLRLRSLANFLRISMSLLFSLLLKKDKEEGEILQLAVDLDIVIIKNYSFSTTLIYLNTGEWVLLRVKSPSPRDG